MQEIFEPGQRGIVGENHVREPVAVDPPLLVQHPVAKFRAHRRHDLRVRQKFLAHHLIGVEPPEAVLDEKGRGGGFAAAHASRESHEKIGGALDHLENPTMGLLVSAANPIHQVRMAPPHAINTKDPAAVCAHARTVFAELGWAASTPFVERLFREVTRFFEGRHPDYLAIDMQYHSYEHTLQATVCLVDIVRGRQRAGASPSLTRRDAELALAAVLLHDTGYLKRKDDIEGTGAKYTLVHEHRSCDFASEYLPAIGATPDEIEDICAGIRCTGPRNRIGVQVFRRPEAKLVACILVTADYLAQMSAPGYPDKLLILFREFEEAFDHDGIPAEKRPYQSGQELLRKTPDFWHKVVQPMLETDAQGQVNFLSITGQPNPYLDAVEANVAEIQRRVELAVGEC